MRALSNRGIVATVAVVVVLAVGLQIWASYDNARQVGRILVELESAEPDELTARKAREEVVALRVRNQLQAYFWQSLVTSLIPLVPVLAVLVTALFGLQKYLDARQKEREEREQALQKERLERERARLDRAGAELNEILKRLASKEPAERSMGVVALQHFFSPDKAEYHLQALAALMAASGTGQPEEVLRGLRVAADKAVANLDDALLREVSWQGTSLRGVDFADHDLRGLDLRDADLENALLRGCDLSGARLRNASLKGADLAEAVLEGADLSYADLAGASLRGARLTGADLSHARVLNLDIGDADLQGALFEPVEVPWQLSRNWRTARFDPEVEVVLLRRYGPEPRGPRVVMLMWEVPPLVAGGTWTACYHLVRSLRRLGARLTVLVPWAESLILPSPFDEEVEVVALGMEPPETGRSAYAASWSPYGASGLPSSLVSPYGGAWSAAYGSYGSRWSSYGPPAWSGYGGAGGRPPLLYRQGTTLLRLTEDFRRRVEHHCRRQACDLIHAHDWVTFAAAESVARLRGVPWVAHFHSSEAERRPLAPDPVIERLERQGIEKVAQVVVPSRVTASRLGERYGLAEARTLVVPNALSPELVPVSEMGSFEARRVLFLGRLTMQKGLDWFRETALAVRRADPGVRFTVYGEGEEAGLLRYVAGIELLGPLDWSRRGEAFANASALLLTSRSEPFGMVVLEAMQHRVPAFFPEQAGVAEAIRSGVRIRPDAPEETAARLRALLDDWVAWDRLVEEQAQEIALYPERDDQQALLALWSRLAPGATAGAAAS